MMEGLGNWLSPEVMHALGWALIHALWECLGVAALAAMAFAFSRRPGVRYIVGVGALALILVAPVATFIVLLRPAAPVQLSLPSSVGAWLAAVPATGNAYPVVAIPSVIGNRAIGGITDASPGFAMLPWLVGAWLCGVAFLSLRLAGGFLLLEHKRRKQSGDLSPRMLAMCQELQLKLGLHRAVRYLQCDWLQAPAVIGWIHPIVFLPVAALTGLSELQLRAVIAHELAHIRRFDAFVNLFQILVETLLFYHPAVWWLNKRIRAERELCCDEIAVSLSGSRLEYAQAITLMAEWEKTPFLAMAVNRGPLSERVFHIMGRKSVGAGSRMLGLTGSILLLAAGLFAANALFGIAYPIPAQARASVTAVLVSGQTAIDRMARAVLQPGAPAAHITVPDQNIQKDETEPPSPTEAPRNIQPDKLVAPQPDLSRLVPSEPPAAATPVASNPPPAAPTQGEQTVRKTLMAASSLALLAGASQVHAQSNDAPTGTRDPDALTCNAPELVPLAKAVNWRICLQNSLVATLGEDGGLRLGGTAVRSYSDLPISELPTGEGDPNAVTCQEAQLLTGTRWRGPIACAHNAFWAKLTAGGCVLTPDARSIIYAPTSKKFYTLACEHMMGRNGLLPRVFF